MRLAALASVLAPPICAACTRHAPGGGPLCAGCRRSLRWLGPEWVELGRLRLWSPLAYEGAASALVRGLKFRGGVALADVMASQIAANAPPEASVPRAAGALVPVPLHPARRLRRGFNQAERIAAGLGRRTGLEVVDCLERAGGRGTQMGRDRIERERAVHGAVRVRRGARCPREATLVDDVATTGATLLACADALRDAGCACVGALVYARTPGR